MIVWTVAVPALLPFTMTEIFSEFSLEKIPSSIQNSVIENLLNFLFSRMGKKKKKKNFPFNFSKVKIWKFPRIFSFY